MVHMRSFYWLVCLVLLLGSVGLDKPVAAQIPTAQGGLSVESATLRADAVRMKFDPLSQRMLLLSMTGNITSFDALGGNQRVSSFYQASDHGTPSPVLGMDIASDGTIYLVGNDAASTPGHNIGVVRRGIPDGNGSHVWETVFVTEPYPRSGTAFDHNMNAIVLSPDEQMLYVNSGSRTDHGEVQNGNGQFPDAREVPLTSMIIRVPADSKNLSLPNNAEQLSAAGYAFADGVRNSFSLAFDANGHLYGTENSGDRDDHEELNLLQEGAHYGFPWRMGLTDTPMQFAGYDAASDLLLNPNALAVQGGHFYTDPSYPAVPSSIQFTDPILNLGPDANLYRDPLDGIIKDASLTGEPIASFTSHRSPLGLVFDTDESLADPYKGDAFVLSWTGPESGLLGSFEGEGEDLLHLTFESGGSGNAMTVQKLVTGFQNPIDAELLQGHLYVLEFGSGSRVWKVSFPGNVGSDVTIPAQALRLDIFPNPLARHINLTIHSPISAQYTVDLLDVTGRSVGKLFEGFLTQGDHHLSRYLERTPAGVYLLSVQSESGERLVKKIVVTRSR